MARREEGVYPLDILATKEEGVFSLDITATTENMGALTRYDG